MKFVLKYSFVNQVINKLDHVHYIRPPHRDILKHRLVLIFEDLITYAVHRGYAKSEELWELDDVYKNLMCFIQLLEKRKEEKNEI